MFPSPEQADLVGDREKPMLLRRLLLLLPPPPVAQQMVIKRKETNRPYRLTLQMQTQPRSELLRQRRRPSNILVRRRLILNRVNTICRCQANPNCKANSNSNNTSQCPRGANHTRILVCRHTQACPSFRHRHKACLFHNMRSSNCHSSLASNTWDSKGNTCSSRVSTTHQASRSSHSQANR